MNTKTRYPIAQKAVQLCSVLKISHQRVFRRAGLSPDFDKHENGGIDAQQYFAIWDAVVAEAKRPDLALFLGEVYARGPFIPAVFAFSCSPTVAIGLERLALFKPLLGPIRLVLERSSESISIQFVSADPTADIPLSMAPFEIVYFLELARNFTTEHIIPLTVEMPGCPECQTELERHAGISFTPADRCRLVLSAEDANLPLISENEELWAEFEGNLKRQLAEREHNTVMGVRVKNALLEMLPSGTADIDTVCDRLCLSRRSLQRALKSEGKSFQTILDATRSELSMHYLSKDELSVEEISYLLAYRDPNSFYRAFHGWTGMTPAQARGQNLH